MKIDSALKSAYESNFDLLADSNTSKDDAINIVKERVWDILLSRRIAVDASRNGGKHGSFALAELAKAINVPGERLRATYTGEHSHLIISMPNGNYYFTYFLYGKKMYSSPIGLYLWTSRSIICKLNAESMARFISEFDAIVPEIEQAVDNMRAIAKKESIVDNIEISFVDGTLEKILVPVGITYGYEIFKDGISITVKVSGRMGLRIKTTLDRLESISNSIPSMLEDPVKAAKLNNIELVKLKK